LILAPFLALLLPEMARAGPPEQLTQVAIHPSDPKRMVVRYFNGGDGEFVSNDGGKTWQLLCDSLLFTDPTIKGGPLVISNDGTMSMGVFTGLWHDDGHACAWSSEPKYDGQWVGGLALDPTDPDITYAVTSSGGKENGLLRRDKSGTWSDLGTKEMLLLSDVSVVAKGTGRRFYAAGVKGEIIPSDGGLPESNYVIRVTDDDGATWTEHVYGGAHGIFHVQGVDPTNPDRIIASIERAGDSGTPAETVDSILVSSDQGKTFKPYLTITEVGGVAFAPDGRVWIGDAGYALDSTQPKGLYFAPSLDKPATKLSMGDYPVQCLDYQPSTSALYACQYTTFGAVDAKSGAFTTLLDVRTVASFIDCSGVDMAAVCQTQLCNAYCGLGHFAQAPVCCAYDTFSCGPAAADNVVAVCPATGTGGTAGAGGAGGTTSSGGASGGGGTSGAAGASTAGTAGNDGATHNDAGVESDGGAVRKTSSGSSSCNVMAGRSARHGRAIEALALALAALGVARRKRL
jgi:hypothetical protein